MTSRRFEHYIKKLTPHSRLYITVPTYSFLWSHEDDYAGHFRRYTVSRLMRTLHQAGFITEYSTYFFAPLILPILFLRAIPHYLGFVKEHRSENDARDHILTPNSSSSRIINAFLDYELDIISKGRSIFAGTSCMVVAKKDI
jgi:hypothetical protein